MRLRGPFMRRLPVLCGFLLLGLGLQAASAQSQASLNVRSAFLKVVDKVYLLSARVELPIDAQLRQALNDGVPVKVGFEMEVSRARNYLPDKTVATLVQQYELRYHAVSDRYLVRNLNSAAQDTFPSLDAALETLTHIESLPVLDSALTPKDHAYEARLRVTFDVGEMPTALRWLLFWSDRYRVSEWYLWSLPRQ